MRRDAFSFDLLPSELVVDSFAGGGGASTGIEAALGRAVDIAINHDPQAVALHTANHPLAQHFCESIYKVRPEDVVGGPVGLMWASPDCTHFSKARGAAPASPRVRGLAWVVVRWARVVAPRVLMLENVEEFADWGPLQADGMPCPLRKGATFRLWCNQLRGLGYQLEHRILRACDYGAPTSRRRLFVIARRDGLPIVWPKATHGPGTGQPYRTAAECIDWTVPCRSIFGRERDLAEATLRRIAVGIQRYVLSGDPYVVPGSDGSTAAAGFLAPRYTERQGQAPRAQSIGRPLPVIVPTGNSSRLIVAFLSQNNGGMVGHRIDKPMSTIIGKGSTQSPVAVALEQRADHAEDVRAFLIKYHANGGQWSSLHDPMPTVTTREGLGLVTVRGTRYAIVDIGMRMLTPRELYTAQGFPPDYLIDIEHDGRPLPKASQARMCGNSVAPPVAEAMVRANFQHERQLREAA